MVVLQFMVGLSLHLITDFPPRPKGRELLQGVSLDG